jgi:ribonuclease-3
MIDPTRHIAKQFGYTFEDGELLSLALTHRSAAKNHNERLEFLGDAVLGMVVAEWLYLNFPNEPEGKLTRMRASLVKGDTLASLAKTAELGDLIQLGPGELKSGGHRRTSILADVVESLLGAIYLDAGLDACRDVILRLLQNRLNALDPNAHPKDAKTRLQEYLQSRKLPLPDYEVLSIEGKDHAQTFTVSCNIQSIKVKAQGAGASRRRAEQNAADKALSTIEARK